MRKQKFYCGKILILGRVNTGKSTLFNALVNKNLSIVSNKKYTTIKNVLGVKTDNFYQTIYNDTPGIYKKNFYYLKNVKSSIDSINLILLIVERTIWNQYDEKIYQSIKNNNIPIIVVINKIDLCKKKNLLLPHIQFIYKKINPVSIIPISAKKKYNLYTLSKIIKNLLPTANHVFDHNTTTNQTHYEICSNIIKETLFKVLNKEIPYKTDVFTDTIKKTHYQHIIINSKILSTCTAHTKIIIGKGGKKIKNISMLSRKKIEMFLKKKVHLFVKVIQNNNK